MCRLIDGLERYTHTSKVGQIGRNSSDVRRRNVEVEKNRLIVALGLAVGLRVVGRGGRRSRQRSSFAPLDLLSNSYLSASWSVRSAKRSISR